MVLAAAGGGDEPQDVAEGLADSEFGANNPGLARDAAETGEREQSHAVMGRGRGHFGPRGGGARGESDRPAVVRRRADRNEPGGLALPGQVT
jgi:hypothetical protein